MFRDTELIRRAGGASSGVDSLPADITDLVLRRIFVLSLFAAALAAVGFTASLIFPMVMEREGGGGIDYDGLEMAVDVVTILVSLAVAWTVRRRWLSGQWLITLGLVFGVCAGMWLAIGECFALVKHGYTPMAYYSLNFVWVVFFPAIVPIRMRTTLVVVLLISAMAPVSRQVIAELGWIVLPKDSQAALIIFTCIAAAMGLVVSRVVYKLGRSVKAARELGSYHLEELLGKGGMGEVWRADHKMLARPAAVKIIRPDATGSADDGITLLKRFEAEAQATARLRSPHTIQIYDFGLAPDGTFFYVMELLDGIDLESLVERFGSQKASRVVFLLEQACHSLTEAHDAGLIHRDIKPANLFVCKYGSDHDFLKVLDFGLVKEHEPQPNATKLTQRGSFVGTPAFLPPELALGQADVDGRADLYALGCVAYWLLTGALVFEARTPMEMVLKHANEDPRPPSVRSELTVPPELDAIVMACLEKDPADRPQSAAELAEGLRAVEVGEPWTPGQAKKWWAVHRRDNE